MGLRLAHGLVVSVAGKPIMSPALSRLQRYHRRHARPARAAALLIEDRVRAASLGGELRSHPPG